MVRGKGKMRIFVKDGMRVETSNFCTHIPLDGYQTAKWVPGRIFVHPDTFEKIRKMETAELTEYVKQLKLFRSDSPVR
jgi:hypothetical protein